MPEELTPLPDPASHGHDESSLAYVAYFTADQMQAYALENRRAQPAALPPKERLALNTRHPDCHKAADAFWSYWNENGETHKRGYYESTWGAINRALRTVGVVEHGPSPAATVKDSLTPDSAPSVAPETPKPVADSFYFIKRTNEEYRAWCRTYYSPDALESNDMVSLHGLWAWQEQERRKEVMQSAPSVAPEPVAWSPSLSAIPEPHRVWVTGKPDQDDIDYWRKEGYSIDLAYKHPPRAPLTDEQISNRLWEAEWPEVMLSDFVRQKLVALVRSVERAHGIRGQG